MELNSQIQDAPTVGHLKDRDPVLDRVSAALDAPDATARVAQYILEHPEKAVRQSLLELSVATQSGQATIFRLCKQLGFKGLTDFRLSLAAELGRQVVQGDQKLGKTESDFDVIASALSQSILSSRRLLTPQLLDQVATSLTSARRISIYGSGESSLAGEVLSYRLSRTGIDPRLFSNTGRAHQAADQMIKEDVAIGISQSGASTDTIDFLRRSRRAGAFAIAITCHTRSLLARHSDMIIPLAKPSRPPSGHPMTILPSVALLAEVLAESLAKSVATVKHTAV